VRLFFHCAIQRLLDAIADLCSSKARIVYLQDRDRICAIASIILNYADAGLRCPKDFETAVVLVFGLIYFVDLPEDSMVFDISQVIRLAEGSSCSQASIVGTSTPYRPSGDAVFA
jgi:hypothetical protein